MVSPLIGYKNGWVIGYRKFISSIFDKLTVPLAPFNICYIPSMRGFHIGGLWPAIWYMVAISKEQCDKTNRFGT